MYAFAGDGTEYSPALPRNGAANFACSYPYLSPLARTYFAAISHEQWNSSLHCGQCVRVTCLDPRCFSGEEVVAVIVDECMSCAYGDLDFSMPAWNALTGLTPDRVQIGWNFTSCAPYTNGSIVVGYA